MCMAPGLKEWASTRGLNVQAEMDGRMESVDGASRFAFTWNGFDENDPVSGRGWLHVAGNQAEGKIFIHQGDDSGLNAVRQV